MTATMTPGALGAPETHETSVRRVRRRAPPHVVSQARPVVVLHLAPYTPVRDVCRALGVSWATFQAARAARRLVYNAARGVVAYVPERKP